MGTYLQMIKMIVIISLIFTNFCHSSAHSKDTLLVYTEEMDSLCINISKYDYILVFDMYLCKSCILPKIKKKKILLIPLDNDVTYDNRIHAKLTLKRDYPASKCYFLCTMAEKKAIVQLYARNQIIKIEKKK